MLLGQSQHKLALPSEASRLLFLSLLSAGSCLSRWDRCLHHHVSEVCELAQANLHRKMGRGKEFIYFFCWLAENRARHRCGAAAMQVVVCAVWGHPPLKGGVTSSQLMESFTPSLVILENTLAFFFLGDNTRRKAEICIHCISATIYGPSYV